MAYQAERDEEDRGGPAAGGDVVLVRALGLGVLAAAGLAAATALRWLVAAVALPRPRGSHPRTFLWAVAGVQTTWGAIVLAAAVVAGVGAALGVVGVLGRDPATGPDRPGPEPSPPGGAPTGPAGWTGIGATLMAVGTAAAAVTMIGWVSRVTVNAWGTGAVVALVALAVLLACVLVAAVRLRQRRPVAAVLIGATLIAVVLVVVLAPPWYAPTF